MDILLSPPVTFAFFSLVGIALYGFGRLLAPPFTPTTEKITSYAGGENIQNQRAPFSYQDFFRTALFYTVMEVGAFVIATIPTGQSALWAIVYLVVISVSVATLTFKYD
ncbi:hypothetical protein AUK40_03685 [Candidatus Wirthbacteria bacterium CG2_30_54_11]|uniref:NADH-quinone oxidoreductase subunit n=1 Tax=Candidatus Wirthbacteria bacterium CG2_30_54_11 TaxID=1817892 RepID=A0A1J5J134_9BACT|nr:MAG: hypothetical protein AUK40_03685 [Candidatus Wirthbacteria bacterium CG2_30_54_11]